jgi:hypothetical protein
MKLLTKMDNRVFAPQTPVNIINFAKYTMDHPNKALINYLLNGLQEGFRLGFTGERITNIMRNLSSLELSPQTLPAFINKEIELGRIAGPFSVRNPPVDKFMVNPLGLVEKRYTNPIEYRVITHHSAPHGTSVNDGIHRHEFHISFDTMKHAVRWIRFIGNGALLTKIDIKDAYRQLPVHPIDQLLQGIIYDNQLYFDKALAFGSRSSCGIFCRFADIVAWIAFSNGILAIIHYVDDYLIISDPSNYNDKNKFIKILDELNIPVKISKVDGPKTKLTYLGFEIDTINMTASLTKQRKEDLRAYLEKWYKRRSAHSREIKSLVGYLLWVCQVLPRARPYVQRFLDLQNRLENKERFVTLSKELKDDISWWLNAITKWSGIYLFEETSWLKPDIQKFFTDASNYGGGATFNNYFIAYIWSDELDPAIIDINIRELMAIIIAVKTFRSLWSRRKYILFTDNASCVANIKKGYASNELANIIIRDLYEQQAVFSFSIKVDYIATFENRLADMLSREQHRQFIRLYPNSIYLTPNIPLYLSHLIKLVPSLKQ